MRVVRLSLFLIAAMITTGLFRDRIPQPVWDRVAMPFRIARLAAETADPLLVMPVAGVHRARVVDTWQAPRPRGRTHEGVDIFAKHGAAVRSATRGIVVRIGENRLGGNTVSVAGAGGRVYYYAHLDGYAEGLRFGERVTTETVLGYVGNTGNARTTPPHLHFGVYGTGGAMDPLPLLADRPDQGRG